MRKWMDGHPLATQAILAVLIGGVAGAVWGVAAWLLR